MATERTRQKWLREVAAVSKARQREVITDARDEGGLTYEEIGEAMGLGPQRIKMIVLETRKERHERAAQPAN